MGALYTGNYLRKVTSLGLLIQPEYHAKGHQDSAHQEIRIEDGCLAIARQLTEEPFEASR